MYRFLLKATNYDPKRRFQSADDMADQLGGVLPEVVASDQTPRPFDSALFHGDVLVLHEQEALDAPDANWLPDLKINADDPGAGFLMSMAGVSDLRRQADLLRTSLPKFPESAELLLRLARTLSRWANMPRRKNSWPPSRSATPSTGV